MIWVIKQKLNYTSKLIKKNTQNSNYFLSVLIFITTVNIFKHFSIVSCIYTINLRQYTNQILMIITL